MNPVAVDTAATVSAAATADTAVAIMTVLDEALE